jgi:hypothetical protein
VGALAWMRVLTVSRGCTATEEALIAAAPAAAWPANTLSPSGLPPPTIAAEGWSTPTRKWRKAATRRFRGRGRGGGAAVTEPGPSHRKQPISLMGGIAAGPLS